MNTSQRIILALGVIALLTNGLFPPFQGELNLGDDKGKYELFLGYRFLFTPPSKEEIYSPFFGRAMPENFSGLMGFNAHIANSKVWLQFATITFATVGLLLLFAGRSKREP